MIKVLVRLWLVALLVCVLLAAWRCRDWRKFARSPAQIDGQMTTYGSGHGQICYEFRVAGQIYTGEGNGRLVTENPFIGCTVRIYYAAGDPSLNSLERPSEVSAFVKNQFVHYVVKRMLWASLVLVLIYQFTTRAHVTGI